MDTRDADWNGERNFFAPLEQGEFELYPYLRARYGNLLSDSVVSVRLFAVSRTVRVTVIYCDGRQPVHIDFERTPVEDNDPNHGLLIEEFFNEDQLDAAPYPHENADIRQQWLVRALERLYRIMEARGRAVILPVFTPHFLHFLTNMGRYWDESNLTCRLYQELDYAENQINRLNRVYNQGLRLLAEPVKERMEAKIIKTLRERLTRQAATQIFGSDLITYWDEIGVLSCEGSENSLYGFMKSELGTMALDEIMRKPLAERFALSFCNYPMNGDMTNILAVNNINDIEALLIGFAEDIEIIAENIASQVIGLAGDTLSPEAIAYLGY